MESESDTPSKRFTNALTAASKKSAWFEPTTKSSNEETQEDREETVNYYRKRLSDVFENALERSIKTYMETYKAILADINKFYTHGDAEILRRIDKAIRAFQVDLHYAKLAAETPNRRKAISDKQVEGLTAHCSQDRIAIFIESVKFGKVDDRDGPMGVAEPIYKLEDCPDVIVLSPRDGTFKIKPVTAKLSSPHLITIMPIGQYKIGKIETVNVGVGVDVRVFANAKSLLSITINGADPAWKGLTLCKGVSPSCFNDILIREMEHAVDFDYAFDLAAGGLAKAINALESDEFCTADAAVQALVNRLTEQGLAQLIPADPMADGAWLERLMSVLKQLAQQSSRRDEEGTHSPASHVAQREGDIVIYGPTFKADSLSTSKIVSLEHVGVVYANGSQSKSITGDEEVAPIFSVGSKVCMRKFSFPDCFTVLGNETNSMESGNVTPDVVLEVAIEANADGKVWVQVQPARVRVNGCNQQLVFFFLHTSELRSAD